MGLTNPSSSTVNQTTDPVGTMWSGWNIDDFEQYATGSSPTLDKGYGWGGAAVMSGTNSIISVSDISGVSKKRLSMTNAEFIRPMSWGSKWKFLRIGCLLTIAAGATITSGGGLCFGICSGTSNGVKGGSPTTNYYGITIQTGAGFPPVATWTRTAGTDHAWFSGPFLAHGNKLTGASGPWTNLSALLSSGEAHAGGGSGGLAIPIILEIRRPLYGSTTYDIATAAFTPTGNLAEKSLSTSGLMGWMELRDFVNRNTYRSNAATTITGQSESSGVLNCLNFAVFDASNAFELSAIAVQKVA